MVYHLGAGHVELKFQINQFKKLKLLTVNIVPNVRMKNYQQNFGKIQPEKMV